MHAHDARPAASLPAPPPARHEGLDGLRAWSIGWAFMRFGLGLALSRLGIGRAAPAPADRFALLLQGLGTTFVKMGQHLSLRPDLLAPDYVAALERLQDRVGEFPSDVAQREIEAALGAPLQQLFRRFEPRALAAGSVAQIHRAVLPDGREVVVKVCRPGIAAQVDRDMRLLRRLARVAQSIVPGVSVYQPVAIVDEIHANLKLELDFHREARYVHRFAQAFAASSTVMVPDAVAGMCAENVFVQVFSDGVRIDEVHDPVQGVRLAEAVVAAYMQQLFELGVFHGDPHPGNLFVMPDGRVCLHDFGIVGHLDLRLRRALAAFAAGFVSQDAEWVVDAWLEMGVIAGRAQRSIFSRVVAELVREYAQRPLAEWSLAQAFARLVAVGRASAVRIPLDLLVLSRAVLLLESTLARIAPGFSVFEALSRHAQQAMEATLHVPQGKLPRLQYELAATAQELPALLARTLQGARDGELKLRLEVAPTEGWQQPIVHGSGSVALALVTLGLYVAASLLMQHSLGPMVAGIPLLSIVGYAVAAWYTLRVARAARRSGV